MITCTKDCSVISAEKSWHVELKCSIYKKKSQAANQFNVHNNAKEHLLSPYAP